MTTTIFPFSRLPSGVSVHGLFISICCSHGQFARSIEAIIILSFSGLIKTAAFAFRLLLWDLLFFNPYIPQVCLREFLVLQSFSPGGIWLEGMQILWHGTLSPSLSPRFVLFSPLSLFLYFFTKLYSAVAAPPLWMHCLKFFNRVHGLWRCHVRLLFKEANSSSKICSQHSVSSNCLF